MKHSWLSNWFLIFHYQYVRSQLEKVGSPFNFKFVYLLTGVSSLVSNLNLGVYIKNFTFSKEAF